MNDITCQLIVNRTSATGSRHREECGKPASRCKCTGTLGSIEMNLCGLHRSHVARFYKWVVTIL